MITATLIIRDHCVPQVNVGQIVLPQPRSRDATFGFMIKIKKCTADADGNTIRYISFLCTLLRLFLRFPRLFSRFLKEVGI